MRSVVYKGRFVVPSIAGGARDRSYARTLLQTSSSGRVWRALRARNRLLLGVVVGALATLLHPSSWSPAVHFVVSWDAGACTYLVATLVMIARSDAGSRRARARDADAGATGVLLAALGSVVACIVAIVTELVSGPGGQGATASEAALCLVTIVTSWTFVHTMFAVHYAHDYERGIAAHPDDPPPVAGGLDFQSDDVPDYFDFVYFAFIIGVASQTADVVIKGRRMRRVATLHGVFSFFFNTTLLALAVNLASSAF